MNITWKVEKVECLKNSLGVEKLIQKVWYKVLGEETVNGVIHTGQTDGFASISPIGDNFLPFEDLTEDTVIAWCWQNGVDKDVLEGEVTRQVLSKITPQTEIINSPWE